MTANNNLTEERFIGSRFQRLQSLLGCSIVLSLWQKQVVGTTVCLMASGKQRDGERAGEEEDLRYYA